MTQMAQEGSEEVMDEETVSRDAEMELLGEPQADVDGMKGTEELTEDQIYDLLGDEGPPKQNIQDSPDPLEEHPPTEEKEEEPTSSVKLTGEAEVDAVEEVEIAEEEDDIVSSTEQIDEDQSSQDAEPTFTAHDLLAGEDDEEDGIVMEDDLGIIEQDVESTSSIRNSWFQNDDDDIFVEEEPTTSYSTDIPLLNRLSRQMLRSYLDRLVVKDPEQIYLMSVKSDVGKLKTTLSTHNHQTQAMRAAYTSREQEILLELAKEKQKNLELMTRLSTANFKLNEHPRRPRVSQHIDDADHSKIPLAMPPTRSRSFTALKRQATVARSQPYVLSRTPRQTSVSAAPEPPVPESNVSLPTRIIVTLPLVENLRQCPVTDPFDAKPLNEYPPGLLKALHNRTGRVEVLLKTEYDCFLISKKLHGVVKFQLPEGLALPSTAFIRLYYLVESMHDSWLFSSAAKISETGTKFTLGFHGDQRLYMGDRVSFIAYIYLDQQNKFVSEQAVFKMRRPVVQISAGAPIDLP